MSGQLNLKDLKKIREEVTKTIEVVSTEAGNAREAEKISFREWQQAKDKWGDLETKELELQGLINNLELGFLLDTNVNSPHSRILQATKSLKTAARKIDNFGSFLSEIAKFSRILASTIKAIQTGGLLTFPT